MITPEITPEIFFNQHRASAARAREIDEIIEHRDSVLDRGKLDVPITRDGWSDGSIHEVTELYRAAGWIVDDHQQSTTGIMLRFRMPVAPIEDGATSD